MQWQCVLSLKKILCFEVVTLSLEKNLHVLLLEHKYCLVFVEASHILVSTCHHSTQEVQRVTQLLSRTLRHELPKELRLALFSVITIPFRRCFVTCCRSYSEYLTMHTFVFLTLFTST